MSFARNPLAGGALVEVSSHHGQQAFLWPTLAFLLLPFLALLSMWWQPTFPDAVPTVLIVGVGVALYLILIRRKNLALSIDTQWCLMALLLFRVCVALWINQHWWWPQAVANPVDDWDKYEEWGWWVSQSMGSLKDAAALPFEELGATYYVGLIYRLVGHNPAALAVSHSLVIAWTALGTFRLATRLGASETVGRRAAVLFSLLPAGLVYGAFPSKDVIVCGVYLLVANLLLEIFLIQGPSVFRVFLLVLSIAVLALTRVAMVYVLGTIILMELFSLPSLRKHMLAVTLAVVALLGTSILFVSWREQTLGRGVLQPIQSIAEWEELPVGQGLEFSSTPESSLAFRLYWNGEWKKAYLIPARSALTLFIPFPPFQFTNLVAIAESLNVWAIALLLPAVAACFRQVSGASTKPWKDLLPCWAPLASVCLAAGAGLPFLQPRYVLPAYPFFCVLASIGFRAEPKHLTKLYELLPVGAGFLLILYKVLK